MKLETRKTTGEAKGGDWEKRALVNYLAARTMRTPRCVHPRKTRRPVQDGVRVKVPFGRFLVALFRPPLVDRRQKVEGKQGTGEYGERERLESMEL